MIGKNPISTPEGYFEDLQQRLLAIPQEHPAVPAGRTPFQRIMPYFALAASIAVAVVAGNFILKQTAGPVPESGTASISLTDDDLVNYLIAEGTSLEHIDYIQYEEDR